MFTKYYYHVVAADRKLFATIAAGRTFWPFAATGKQISIIYLLQLLGKTKRRTNATIFTQKTDFVTDAITQENY